MLHHAPRTTAPHVRGLRQRLYSSILNIEEVSHLFLRDIVWPRQKTNLLIHVLEYVAVGTGQSSHVSYVDVSHVTKLSDPMPKMQNFPSQPVLQLHCEDIFHSGEIIPCQNTQESSSKTIKIL